MTAPVVPLPDQPAVGFTRVDEPQPHTQTLSDLWDDPKGWIGQLAAVQNNVLGVRIIVVAFLFFLWSGVDSLWIRTQLAVPENTLVSPGRFNELFTMHGSAMMYLFAVPMGEGFAILLLPFLLGTREMPFPRLSAYTFWTFLFGGLLFYSSSLFQAVPDAGWFAYVPLSGPTYSPDVALDFWLLALGVAEIAAIGAAIEIIMSILRMRAPGMTLARLPLMAWTLLVTAFSILFAFTPLLIGTLLLESDRKFGTRFFDPAAGGSPILWQHLFWIFGHPEVYIQFLPAVGIVSTILPVFARSRIVGYPFLAMAAVAIAFLSFGLWVHHMFTTGLPTAATTYFAVASMMIAIPSGVQIFAWLATLWRGRPTFQTPMLFVLGFLFLFVLGGVTGVMVAAIPFDLQVHDTYFVVAHFHYVLVGGVVFPILAGLYYWMPKFTNRLLDEGLGRWHFWLFFLGANLAFFPMHIVGMLGMARRVYTYPAGYGWEIYNILSTIGAAMMAVGTLIFIGNVVLSMRSGKRPGPNPWDADTLEWAPSTPAPQHGFTVMPIIHSRHPLWDQTDLHTGDPRIVALVRGLARWPLTWRAVLVTSLGDARPQEVARVSGPSIWPFIAGVATIVIFASEIWSLRWLAASAAVVVVIALIGWHWPKSRMTTDEEERAFEREHGIPVYSLGSPTMMRGALMLVLLVIGVALACLLFSYFYIRLENDAWPPPGFGRPDLTLPGIAAALILGSAAAMGWAVLSIRADRQLRLRIALAVAAVLGLAAIGLQGYVFLQLGYSHETHAYGSAFFILSIFGLVVAVAGLLMNLFSQVWAWRRHYSARRHDPISNAAMFWFGATVVWLLSMGTLYLTPYLT